jgi:hypothetical protein
MGMTEAKASISNEISRRGFPVAFLVAGMQATGVQQLRIEDV